MKKSNYIVQCKKCGEFRGLLVNETEPSHVTRSFCRCEPEGWEICRNHEGHVRRRHGTIKIHNANGERSYFSVYSMIAPCNKNKCFKASDQFLKEVQEFNDSRKRINEAQIEKHISLN